MDSDSKWGVRFTTYTIKGAAKYGEKFFATEAALEKWVTRQLDSGRDIEMTSYCAPRVEVA